MCPVSSSRSCSSRASAPCASMSSKVTPSTPETPSFCLTISTRYRAGSPSCRRGRIDPRKRQVGSALRLDVYPPPQVLQIDGRLCHLVLAFPMLEASQMAGPLRFADIAPLQRYYGPSRHPLVFGRASRFRRLYGLPCSSDFSLGREGELLQLLSMSSSPCCRFHPRRGEQPHLVKISAPCCLRPTVAGSALGDFHFRGPQRVHFCYSPVTRGLPLGRPRR